MTTTSVEAFAPEVHMGFGDYIYTVEDLTKKFDALRRLWNACREIENIEFVHWEPNVLVLPQIPCIVRSLRMQSPLWVELLFPGAGVGAGVTAVRLFTRVLKDPRALAEWLPSFVEAWHRKWADAERARIEHSEAHRQRLAYLQSEVSDAVSEIGHPPISIETTNLPDKPDIPELSHSS